MQLRKVFRVALKAIAILGFIPFVFFSYVIIATHNAKSQAETICLSVPIGANADVAEKIVQGVKAGPRMQYSRPEMISVGFQGAFVERWFCNFTITQGKVAAYEVRLID